MNFPRVVKRNISSGKIYVSSCVLSQNISVNNFFTTKLWANTQLFHKCFLFMYFQIVFGHLIHFSNILICVMCHVSVFIFEFHIPLLFIQYLNIYLKYIYVILCVKMQCLGVRTTYFLCRRNNLFFMFMGSFV